MNKLVIGIFGKINSGKSTLLNSLAKENVSIVSGVEGSTSDSVYKMTEIDGIGRVQLIDTAGYDDKGELAKERLSKVKKDFELSDIVIIVCKENLDEIDEFYINECKKNNKQFIICHNILNNSQLKVQDNEFWVNVQDINGVDSIIQKIKQKSEKREDNILGDLVGSHDNVLLCMPQDDGAPTGRLILPQSVVIRAIMDKGGVPIISTKENFESIYLNFGNKLKLVITDSSIFDYVSGIVGNAVPLTSFSVLFAKYNGDIQTFVDGAESIASMQDGDSVLIMEACSHTLSHKDIGSVLIPNLIKKYTGKNISFEFLRGRDEPQDWKKYKLVVHCGGCTQNSAFMLARINKCKQNNIPITNYGVLIAKIKGILDKIVY